MDLQTAHLKRLDALRTSLQGLTDGLSDHAVYELVSTTSDLQVFMEHHVWAVWDFMNLLKAIQQRFTSTLIPWTPRGDGNMRRFVNEIVLDEESDKKPHDGYSSHFEIYLAAMVEVGARTEQVVRFIERLDAGEDFYGALADSGCPPAVVAFLDTTWRAARAGDAELVAAFTFGREAVIPPMFRQFLARSGGLEHAEMLRYYLERHVELDGDSHSGLAESLLASSCGDDPAAWRLAEASARDCLVARGRLWDAVAGIVAPANLHQAPAKSASDAAWLQHLAMDDDEVDVTVPTRASGPPSESPLAAQRDEGAWVD
jgi:Protein of unknown function (DUF3050)